jgi:DNA-binding CsgD family transcriptional regulator
MASRVSSSDPSTYDSRSIDLSRLTEREREALRLIAQGHTAKSIANLHGSTPVAVNERLREARRKTGISSSRELARLLRSEEHRNTLSRGARLSGRWAVQSPEPWPFHAGISAMVGLLVVVMAGGAVLIARTPSPMVPIDPLYRGLAAEQPPSKLIAAMKTAHWSDKLAAAEGSRAILRSLYAKVRSERRDPQWAPQHERALRAIFTAIPHVGGKGTGFRVKCATTLCEVGGSIDSSFARPSTAREKELDRRTMALLNPHALGAATDRLHLQSSLASIGTTSERPPREAFLFYYMRRAQACATSGPKAPGSGLIDCRSSSGA